MRISPYGKTDPDPQPMKTGQDPRLLEMLGSEVQQAEELLAIFAEPRAQTNRRFQARLRRIQQSLTEVAA